MNVENLKKLIAFIPTIPADKLDMKIFRSGNKLTHECESSGCIVGWGSILLSKKQFEDYSNKYIYEDCLGGISISRFALKWSMDFFDLSTEQWDYLFGEHNSNSKESAIFRIDLLISRDGNLPVNNDLLVNDDLPF